MKNLFIIFVALFVGITAISAQTHVNGYYRKDGTYVQSHTRSSKNNTNHDNYSTTNNSNPYTGQKGSVARDYSSEAANYGSGKQIQTGERGGKYYINDKGNKTYVPKQPTDTSLDN
ncbi:MAG: hypothetical protein RR285_11810 [Acinetobacter sp.]